MLVLTRKVNESIIIGSTIEIQVLESHNGKVRLGFSAPQDVAIHRHEVRERIAAQSEESCDVRAS